MSIKTEFRRWFSSLSLTERLLLAGDGSPKVLGQPSPEQQEALRIRLDRWCKTTGCPSTLRLSEYFGVSEATLSSALSSSEIQEVPDGALLANLYSAYRSCSSETLWSRGKLIRTLQEPRRDLSQFRPLVQGWAADITSVISCVLAHTPIRLERASVELGILKTLELVFVRTTLRCVILDMHSMRLRDELAGASPHERFDAYIASNDCFASVARLFKQYPVLERRLTAFLSLITAHYKNCALRLADDWIDLQSSCFESGAPPSGIIVSIDAALGDFHNGAQSVTSFTFEDNVKLLYKPRNLKLEQQYSVLYREICESLGVTAFCHKLLVRAEYGWELWVDSACCDTEEQVHNYLERMGIHLALLHVLRATDIHFDNVIAHGDHPVIIDLEGLFQPEWPTSSMDPGMARTRHLTSESVLNVGILPSPQWVPAAQQEADMSVLGSREGMPTPTEVEVWEQIGTDNQRVAKRFLRRGKTSNLLYLREDPVEIAEYTTALTRGFRRSYAAIRERFGHDSGANSLTQRFVGSQCRLFRRPTSYYHSLIYHSFNPQALTDGTQHELVLSQLTNPAIMWETEKALEKWEILDLIVGDVPLFTSAIDSTIVNVGQGRSIAGVISISGVDLVLKRLLELSDDDCERQVAVIEASLALRRTPPVREKTEDASSVNLSREQILDSAIILGQRLRQQAFNGLDGPAWIGLIGSGQRYVLRCLQPDVYFGNLGPLIFLAMLAKITDDDTLRRFCVDVFQSCLAQQTRQLAAHSDTGAFGPITGLLYAAHYLSSTLGSSLCQEVEARTLPRLEQLISEDLLLDVLSGCSGCLLVLARIHAKTANPGIAQLMALAVERLSNCVISYEGVPAWPTYLEAGRPLTGFSHGHAGIAAALGLAWASTNNTIAQDLCRLAIQYERICFSESEGNWPDYRIKDPGGFDRTNADGLNFSSVWCHGSAGIGLSRHILSEVSFPDKGMQREIACSLENLLQHGFGKNDCLCHGDLGNLDILMQLTRSAAFDQLPLSGISALKRIVERVGRNEVNCGTPRWMSTPSLMVGTSGIGLGLLRLAFPSTVPSILSLAL